MRPRQRWPAFVVGSYRTGSTLLRFILDSHSELSCHPESKLLISLEAALAYPEVSRGVSGLGISHSEMICALGGFVDALFMQHATRFNKQRWIDKTPDYYKILPFIDKMFLGQVFYICIIRHPLDCIMSLEEFFTRVGYHDNRDISEHIARHGTDRHSWAELWLTIYKRIRIWSSSVGDRFCLVRYEDLVRSPEDAIRDILSAIDARYEPDLHKLAFELQHAKGIGDPKILQTRKLHDASIGRRMAICAAEADLLWEIVGPTAGYFGYHTPR